MDVQYAQPFDTVLQIRRKRFVRDLVDGFVVARDGGPQAADGAGRPKSCDDHWRNKTAYPANVTR